MPTFKDNALCPIIIIYKTSCICNYENGFNSPSGNDNLFDFKEIYIIKKINIVFCYFLKKKKNYGFIYFIQLPNLHPLLFYKCL